MTILSPSIPNDLKAAYDRYLKIKTPKVEQRLSSSQGNTLTYAQGFKKVIISVPSFSLSGGRYNGFS